MKQKSHDFHEQAIHGKNGFPMIVYQNDFLIYVNQQIPWHWHEELEFGVVTKGIVEFSVAGEVFLVKEGEGIFINANVLHHMKPHGTEKAYMFSILIHPGMLGSERGYLLSVEYVEPYINDTTMPFYVFRKENDIIDKLMLIDNIFTKKPFAYELLLRNYACELWFNIISYCWKSKPVANAGKGVEKNRIQLALQYIHEHYQENIGLDEISKAATISRSECCRCFQRNLQMSPVTYLSDYRMEMATRLLRTSNLSITQIAIQTGFNGDSYFCKIFKKYMNCTPLQYRKNGKKKPVS